MRSADRQRNGPVVQNGFSICAGSAGAPPAETATAAASGGDRRESSERE